LRLDKNHGTEFSSKIIMLRAGTVIFYNCLLNPIAEPASGETSSMQLLTRHDASLSILPSLYEKR